VTDPKFIQAYADILTEMKKMEMTPDDQEARALKFERTGTVNLRQLRSGNFALYEIGGVGSPFWIGPADQVLGAYANRPPPTPLSYPRAEKPKNPLLDKLEFTI